MLPCHPPGFGALLIKKTVTFWCHSHDATRDNYPLDMVPAVVILLLRNRPYMAINIAPSPRISAQVYAPQAKIFFGGGGLKRG